MSGRAIGVLIWLIGVALIGVSYAVSGWHLDVRPLDALSIACSIVGIAAFLMPESRLP